MITNFQHLQVTKMAQIAPITLLDGESTPVSHVFNPVSTLPVATYHRSGVADQPAVAWEILKVEAKPASNNGIRQVVVDLALPVLEQATGGTYKGYVAPPSLAFTLRAKVTYYLPTRSTTQQRKNLRAMSRNSLDNAQVIAAIEAFEQPY